MLRLIINLDRSPERLARMQAQFEALNLDFIRIAGIDAKTFSKEMLQSHVLPLEKREYFLSPLSEGEIACYLSHLKALQYFVNTNEDWALVCEDDILFNKDIKSFILDPNWIPEDIKLVNIATGYKPLQKIYRLRENLTTTGRLVEHVTYYGGCRAYLIHRSVAESFIRFSKEGLLSAVDDMLFSYYSPFRQVAIPWSLTPAVAFDNDDGVSFIGSSRTRLKSPWWKVPHKYIRRKIMKWKFKAMCLFVCKKDLI